MSTRNSLIDLSMTCMGSLAERCDVLLQRMDEWESEGNKRTRSLKSVDQLNRLTSMRVLIANLYENLLYDPNHSIGLPKNKNWFSGQKDKFGPHLTFKGFWNSIEFLESQEWVKIVALGWKHPDARIGKPTQIQGTKKLLRFLEQTDVSLADLTTTPNLIILRDIEKRNIPVEDIEEVLELKAALESINRVFDSCWIDLEIPDDETNQLKELGLRFPSCLFSKRKVYRVFNRNSFELGGRFY